MGWWAGRGHGCSNPGSRGSDRLPWEALSFRISWAYDRHPPRGYAAGSLARAPPLRLLDSVDVSVRQRCQEGWQALGLGEYPQQFDRTPQMGSLFGRGLCE